MSNDELHLSLDVPERIRERIALWVAEIIDEHIIPTDPNEYHITVAYSEHGVDDAFIQRATNRWNFTGLKFEGKRLTKFNDAVVIELECEHFDKYASMLNDWLEDQGVEVSRHPGGFKPHITVGYSDGPLKTAPLPPLSFRSGRMNFSTPRALSEGLTALYARANALASERVGGRMYHAATYATS